MIKIMKNKTHTLNRSDCKVKLFLVGLMKRKFNGNFHSTALNDVNERKNTHKRKNKKKVGWLIILKQIQFML